MQTKNGFSIIKHVNAEPHEIEAKNINPYLIDYCRFNYTDPPRSAFNVPEIIYGNKPTDEGNLLLTDEERTEILAREPKAEKFILPFVSAHEFINGENRWCIWLKDVPPTEWRNLPAIMERVQAVRAFREKSKKAATVRLAEIPYLIRRNQTTGKRFCFNSASFFRKSTICSDVLFSAKLHCS